MKLIWAATMALGLVSCGPNGGMAQEQEKEQPVVQIEAVPDSEIPTDGFMHVLKRGKFAIEQATLFCGVDADVHGELAKIGVRGLGIDGVILGDALRKMGQSSQHSDGSGRQRMLDGKHCVDDGKTVVYSGRVGLNRTGKPYRLTLVVRQGDALWQGTVERAEGELHPDVFVVDLNDTPSDKPVNLDKQRARKLREGNKQSIELDGSDLSSRFSDYVRR